MSDKQTPPPEQPQITQPAPTTVTVAVVPILMSDGKKWARLHIFSCKGEEISFLPPETAKIVGEQLVAIGKQGNSGIVAPPSALVVPGRE